MKWSRCFHPSALKMLLEMLLLNPTRNAKETLTPKLYDKKIFQLIEIKSFKLFKPVLYFSAWERTVCVPRPE